MSISTLMSVGVKAMTASYAALQTTGNNIANASVSGYSRQQAEMATAQGQYTGAGFIGRGVDVVTVSRSHNEFLTREAASAQSLASMDSTRLTQLQRLESLFPTGENGLGNAGSQFFAALTDLTSQPADLATRQVVLARARDLADRFADAGTGLDDLQSEVSAQLQSSVASVNSLAKSIADVNQKIASMRGLGQPANDLLDERDRLISQLSQQVQVTRVDAGDGTVGLFVGGGQRLVLGNQASQLQVTRDPSDPTRSAVGIVDGASVRTLDSSALGGGAITGLLNFQNEDLADARNLVGQLAAAVGGAVNAQQLKGLSLQSPLGSATTQPMFSMGSPQAYANTGNARNASGQLLGSVALTVTDSSALQASDYALRQSTSTPGSWELTRLSDGVVTTVASGDVVDGMRIDITSGQPGDRFLLQPVARAANGMDALLSDPLDIAAASPLVATAATTNTGTASVGGITVDSAPLPHPGQSDTITFTQVSPPAAGGYDYTYTSSLTGAVTPWRTGQPVVGGNGYTLTLSGVPANGDTVSVDPTAASSLASNNGNALALLGLSDAKLAAGRSATDAWANALSDVGVRVQSAKSSSSISTAVATRTEESRSSESGVNLDEEAARLIQYQQSYQAAAKVLQIAQSLFDSLLQVAAR